MALTKKDLFEFGQILKKDLKEELSKELTHSLSAMWRTDLRVALDQQSQDIKRDIRDEMNARFVAFRSEIRTDSSTLRQEIHTAIAETITDNVLPAIDRLHQNMDHMRQDMDHMHQDLKQEIRQVRTFVGMAS